MLPSAPMGKRRMMWAAQRAAVRAEAHGTGSVMITGFVSVVLYHILHGVEAAKDTLIQAFSDISAVLVDSATGVLDPDPLHRVLGLVVCREWRDLLA